MRCADSASSARCLQPRLLPGINERRRAALEDIDNAGYSWYHARTCLVAAIGFFTDSYDIFAISIAAVMIGYIYGPGGNLTPNQELGIKVATPIGTFVGQLIFGWLADIFGRKKMYGLELVIMINGTFAQTLCGESGAVNIIGTLIVWRFLTGIGIGGDYPLSSVITSEFASTRIRGRMMTAVFSAQGWGTFTAALVSLIVVIIYKRPIEGGPIDVPDVDRCWRILIGIGCVPALLGLYFRMTIPETPRYTIDIERNVAQAARDIELFYSRGIYIREENAPVVRVEAPRATRRDFIGYFSRWENGKVLLGTAWSWFALDIAFYGLGLNSSIILGAIGFGAPSKAVADKIGRPAAVWLSLKNASVGNLIISTAGLIPGFYATMALIDHWGRKPIQYMGFVALTAIFCSMGFGYDKMINHGHQAVFVVLYCLANFFQNFGPNTTTFIVPGEVFPTRYRCTGHGISAASGKLGAIIAQVGFSRLKDIGGPNKFVKHILQIFGLFMLTGVFSTMLIPETKGRTLEDLSNEDQEEYVREIGQVPRYEYATTETSAADASVATHVK